MSISLVAGLGNPGSEYEFTRHNLGWLVIESFAKQRGLVWKTQAQFQAAVARWDRPGQPTCYLVKPLTFMNDSGSAVAAIARFYKASPTAITAIYDDLAIDLGLVKVSVSGSAGGHNGVASLLEKLEDGFVRYRLGIGPKDPPQMDIKDFVLGKFTPDQQRLVAQYLPHYLSGLELLLSRGSEAAMNQLNRRDPK